MWFSVALCDLLEPFGNKCLDVRGIISQRQAAGPSGAHLNPVSSLLQLVGGKQKVVDVLAGAESGCV